MEQQTNNIDKIQVGAKELSDEEIDEITEAILGCCFNVMNVLGVGFLENVYKNSLVILLRSKGLKVQTEVANPVYFMEQIVGTYFADLLVEDEVVVELKSCESPLPKHPQLINC